MAKKNKKKTIVDNAELDALVDEGKDVDVAKVAEVISNNTEETDGVEVEDLIQEDKDAQADEIIKTVMEDAVEDEDLEEVDEEDYPDATDEGPATEAYEEFKDEDSECENESFECDSKDVKEEPKKELKKRTEPWYIARAKREADYYNW